MTKALKTLLPISFRNHFRPDYQYWCTKFINFRETAFRTNQKWKEARVQLQSLTDDEELYEFSQKEFGIIQNKAEILGLLEYLKNRTPEIIVEIGTKDGGNSFLFLETLKEIDTYIGIDLMVKNYDKLKYLVKNSSKIFSIHSNSQFRESIYIIKKLLKGRPIDFLFIDGDHSYEGVKADFEIYSPLVKEGGLIAFHDIVPDKKANDSLWAGEVHRFWQEIKNNYEFTEFVENYEQSGFGIGVIVKS
jgi:cephalosporin hydroxylase